MGKVDLFGAKPLGIFNKESMGGAPHTPQLSIWNEAYERELRQCVTQPPSNGFLEMIQWTKQGKVWTFPIDNEVGKFILIAIHCLSYQIHSDLCILYFFYYFVLLFNLENQFHLLDLGQTEGQDVGMGTSCCFCHFWSF